MPAITKLFRDHRTTMRANLASVLRIHFHNLPASFHRFAHKDEKEHTPRHVSNMLAEMVVRHQVLNQKGLYIKDAKTPNQRKSYLVPEILSLPADLLIQFGDLPPGLLPGFGALSLTGQCPLRSCQLLLCSDQEAGITDHFSRREVKGALNAYVYTHLFRRDSKGPSRN
jgi:hypothetical protein